VLQLAGAVMTPLSKQLVQAKAANKQMLKVQQAMWFDVAELIEMPYSNAFV